MMKVVNNLFFILLCFGMSSCASAQNASRAVAKTDSIAEKMLIYQLSNGGWPKQLEDKSVVKYENAIDDVLLAKIKATTAKHATIDNKATTREIDTLVKAFKRTGNTAYLKAAEKGIDYLLTAQYANGGWPQYYPDNSLYRAEITYNDDAIVEVLTIMLNISTKANDFEVVNSSYISKSADAIKKGVDCILKTQIVQNGQPTIWAAQYDQNTLQPAKARAFEPASLSTSESVGIVRFLMKLKNPSPEVKSAITNAVSWFDQVKIVGYKFEKPAGGNDRSLIADPTSIIWARFYDLQTNEPVFGDRDNKVYKNVAAISFERRNNYGWYGTWGNNLTREYPKWLKGNGG